MVGFKGEFHKHCCQVQCYVKFRLWVKVHNSKDNDLKDRQYPKISGRR
jgi:hypothetical protein